MLRLSFVLKACGLAVAATWYKLFSNRVVSTQLFFAGISMWVKRPVYARLVLTLYSGLSAAKNNISHLLRSYLSTVYTGLTIEATNYLN